jgi:hypothetical protein
MSEILLEELKRRLEDVQERLQAQDNAIIELKSLLSRAADALETQTRVYPGMGDPTASLIALLRKAAQ